MLITITKVHTTPTDFTFVQTLEQYVCLVLVDFQQYQNISRGASLKLLTFEVGNSRNICEGTHLTLKLSEHTLEVIHFGK